MRIYVYLSSILNHIYCFCISILTFFKVCLFFMFYYLVGVTVFQHYISHRPHFCVEIGIMPTLSQQHNSFEHILMKSVSE